MPRKQKTSKPKLNIPNHFVILGFTYATALAILNFGRMNPLVVAFMPCLALSFSLLLSKR